MRLIPHSLFWRLALVLFAGLVTAQLLSLLLHSGERERLMLLSGGTQPAQRIVDAVTLLDATPAAERARLIAILDSPRHPVALNVAAPPATAVGVAPEHPRARAFFDFLVAQLGAGHAIAVDAAIRERPFERPGFAPPHHEAMHPAGRFDGPGFADRLFLTTHVRLRDGQWLRFGSPLLRPSADLPQRLTLSLIVLFGSILVLTLLAVRWLTRPLHQLASAADELGRDLHRAPLAETGPLEARRAAAAFNRMQAQLIRLIDDRTRMLAAMSHDLKTPITRMRLRAELLDDDDLRARFEQDLHEMEAMVRDTLDFMRGLDPGEQRTPIDIAALLDSLAQDNADMGRPVRVDAATAAPYPGVLRLLRRCLGNLIDNAIQYGDAAEIAVDDSDRQLVIRIADRGPGLPEAVLDKVFDPFYRHEASRNRDTGGTGLGLSIARSIAEFHGGTLTLQNRVGGGLEVTLTLPRPAPASAR